MKPDEDTLLTSPTLLARLRQMDDADAWREFLRRYEDRVKGLARRRGLPPADAEDVAQEVFRRVAESIHTFQHSDQRGAFRSWLNQLTRWRVGDFHRRNLRNPAAAQAASEPPSVASEPASDPFSELEAEAREELVRTALRQLQNRIKPVLLQAFELHVLEGQSLLRVAAHLKVSPGSLYVAKFRILRMLREELARLSAELA